MKRAFSTFLSFLVFGLLGGTLLLAAPRLSTMIAPGSGPVVASDPEPLMVEQRPGRDDQDWRALVAGVHPVGRLLIWGYKHWRNEAPPRPLAEN